MNEKHDKCKEEELLAQAKELFPVGTECYPADGGKGIHQIFNKEFYFDKGVCKVYANADDEDFFCIYFNGTWAVKLPSHKDEPIPEEETDTLMSTAMEKFPKAYSVFEHWFERKLLSADIEEASRCFETIYGCISAFFSSYGYEINIRNSSDGCYISLYDSSTDSTSEELLNKTREEGIRRITVMLFEKVEQKLPQG